MSAHPATEPLEIAHSRGFFVLMSLILLCIHKSNAVDKHADHWTFKMSTLHFRAPAAGWMSTVLPEPERHRHSALPVAKLPTRKVINSYILQLTLQWVSCACFELYVENCYSRFLSVFALVGNYESSLVDICPCHVCTLSTALTGIVSLWLQCSPDIAHLAALLIQLLCLVLLYFATEIHLLLHVAVLLFFSAFSI